MMNSIQLEVSTQFQYFKMCANNLCK